MDSMMWKEKSASNLVDLTQLMPLPATLPVLLIRDGIEHQGTYEGALRHAKLMEVIDEVGVQVPAVQP